MMCLTQYDLAYVWHRGASKWWCCIQHRHMHCRRQHHTAETTATTGMAADSPLVQQEQPR